MHKLKITILSLSVVTVMASAAVSPALGVIAEYFSSVNPLLIKLIVTIPSLLIIAISLLFSVIANRWSSRTIAVSGLLLYIIGGCGAGFADSIYLILGFRIILGFGVGLIMPLSTGLIAYYFKRNEQSKLMGYSIAMNNLGGIIAAVLSGFLVSLHWRYTFGIYILGLVVMALVVWFLPKAELKRTGAGVNRNVIRAIAPYALAMFITMVAFYTVPSSFAIIAVQADLVPVAYIGLLMAVQNIMAFSVGLSLSFIMRKTGRYTQYLGSGMLVLAFLGLSFARSLVPVILGLIALGTGMGIVVPILNAQIALRVGKQHITSAMAIMGAMLFLGQFLSPIIIDGAQSLLHLQGIQVPYYFAMGLSALLVISFIKIPVSAENTEMWLEE